MEFMEKVIEFASMAVTAFGGGIAISGLINFGEGKSQQNAGKQDEGISKIIGGAIIMIIGIVLVPQLIDLFTVEETTGGLALALGQYFIR